MSNSPSIYKYSENHFCKKITRIFLFNETKSYDFGYFYSFCRYDACTRKYITNKSFYILLSITLGAGSSAAINMWFDEDIDKSMERTKERPIPLGIISKNEALIFGVLQD